MDDRVFRRKKGLRRKQKIRMVPKGDKQQLRRRERREGRDGAQRVA